MKCVPLCTPKDQWRLPPPSSLVTYLGCRSKTSAVGLTPGSTGYRACGISRLSTVATQASAGWTTGNLHMLSPIWAHFLLYSAAASVCCFFPGLKTLQEVWAVVAPVLSSVSAAPLSAPPVTQSSAVLWGWSGGDAAECCSFWLQLPVWTHAWTWQHVCLCWVVVHCHCTKVAVRSKCAVGSETQVCTLQASLF